VCEPRNDAGLRIPFFHDETPGTVTAASTLTATAEITDHKDRRCTASSATFVVLGEAQAADAVCPTRGDRPPDQGSRCSPSSAMILAKFRAARRRSA